MPRDLGISTTLVAILPAGIVHWQAVNGEQRALLGRLYAVAVGSAFGSKIEVRRTMA